MSFNFNEKLSQVSPAVLAGSSAAGGFVLGFLASELMKKSDKKNNNKNDNNTVEHKNNNVNNSNNDDNNNNNNNELTETDIPFIYKQNKESKMRFAIFNLVPDLLEHSVLRNICDAQICNSEKYYAQDWNISCDISLFGASDLMNPNIFAGKYVPLFIGDFGNFLGFHSNNTPKNSAAETQSYLWAYGNIQDSINLNTAPVLDYLPWGAISFPFIKTRFDRLTALGNPSILPDPMQMFSHVLCHEINETLRNDCIQNYAEFDNFAPATTNWQYVELDPISGNPTNALSVNSDGTQNFPLLNSVFPAGYTMSCWQEEGDATSWSAAMKFNSYMVDGWYMSNYNTPSFWRSQFKSSKYDHMGNCKFAIEPQGGLHEFVTFLDFSSKYSYGVTIANFGPTFAVNGGTSGIYKINVPKHTTIVYKQSQDPIGTSNLKAGSGLNSNETKKLPIRHPKIRSINKELHI